MAQARRRKYHELVDTPHVVYRCLGKGGVLLYVGVTRTFGPRFEHHVCTRPWWQDVKVIALAHYQNGVDAHIAEAAAIETEHPVNNVQTYDLKAMFENARPFRPQRPAGQATTCPKCGEPKPRPAATYCRSCYREYQKARREKLANS